MFPPALAADGLSHAVTKSPFCGSGESPCGPGMGTWIFFKLTLLDTTRSVVPALTSPLITDATSSFISKAPLNPLVTVNSATLPVTITAAEAFSSSLLSGATAPGAMDGVRTVSSVKMNVRKRIDGFFPSDRRLVPGAFNDNGGKPRYAGYLPALSNSAMAQPRRDPATEEAPSPCPWPRPRSTSPACPCSRRKPW